MEMGIPRFLDSLTGNELRRRFGKTRMRRFSWREGFSAFGFAQAGGCFQGLNDKKRADRNDTE
jgi:hypothetical protein